MNLSALFSLNRFFEELDDETKWTRARVEAQIYSAVILAIQMDKNDKTRQHLLATWPAECSVRYEWFESVIADVKLPPNIAPFDNTHDNFYNVLVLVVIHLGLAVLKENIVHNIQSLNRL